MKSLVYLAQRLGRGDRSGWAGWARIHPDFGRLEGTTRQQQHISLLLANLDFQTIPEVRPW